MSDLTAKIVITAKDLTKQAVNGVKNGFNSLVTASDKASKSTDTLGKESEQTAKQQQQQKASTDSLNSSTKSYDSTLSSTTKRLIAFGGAYLGLNKLKDSLISILTVGGKFETLKTQLNSVFGSVEKGEAAFAWIQDFAKNTPLQLDGVTDAFIKMKAFGLDPMDGTMQKLTDVSSKLGGGQERLEGIILAVGQAWTKGKLQAEEANQLIERGVPVYDALAKALGRTTAEIQEMASKGQITRKEINLLIDEIGASAEGAAAAQMNTWAGVISNLEDTWTTFLNTIAESGSLDFFKQKLQDILKTTQEMAADGSLKKWAKDISDGIISIGKSVSGTISFIHEYSGAIAALAGAYAKIRLTTLITGLAGATAGFVATTKETKAATVATTAFSTALIRVKSLISVGLYAILANEIIKVTDAYRQLKEQQKIVNDLEREAASNKTDRLDKLREEAKQLGINTEAYKENVTAIVDAVLKKRQEISANEELAKSYSDFEEEINAAVEAGKKLAAEEEALATAAGSAYQATIDLAESQKTLVDESGKATDEIKKLSDEAIGELLSKIDKINNSNVFVGGGWDDLKNGLLTEQFSRIGLDLEKITGSVTETGKQGADAFTNIAKSAKLTTDQLAEVAKKLVDTANTAPDIDLLRKSFEEVGFEIEKHPNLIAEIVKKMEGLGIPLKDIPAQWREIAEATEEASKKLADYTEESKNQITQREKFNEVLRQEAEAHEENAKAIAKEAAEREENNRKIDEAKFIAATEEEQQAFGRLNDIGKVILEGLQKDNNSKQIGRVSSAELVELALIRQEAATAANNQSQILNSINRNLINSRNTTVSIDGREIAAAINRAGLTSR